MRLASEEDEMAGGTYGKEQQELNRKMEELLRAVDAVRDCKCSQLFTSNRTEGCVSVQDFFDKRFDRKSSPFSPKFAYREGRNDK